MRKRIGLFLVALLLALGIVAVQSASHNSAPSKALPRAPQIVTELYLPEEQKVCQVMYAVYAGLPQREMSRLHQEGRLHLNARKLDDSTKARLAAWFKSARWGCRPPSENLNAAAVSQSTLVMVARGGVVVVALRSPQKQIWKKLTIACAADKAQWVRDGLPLLPSWFRTPWPGGTTPPPLEAVMKEGEIDPFQSGSSPCYKMLRSSYAVYANLSAADLRKLHREHKLVMKFQSLPLYDRKLLADAWDEQVQTWNRAYDRPSALCRTKEMRRKLFGITTVTLLCAHTDTSEHTNDSASPQWTDGLAKFPPPHRAVYLHFDPLCDGDRTPATTQTPPFSALEHFDVSYLVAWPPETQQAVISWFKEKVDWWRSDPTKPLKRITPWD